MTTTLLFCVGAFRARWFIGEILTRHYYVSRTSIASACVSQSTNRRAPSCCCAVAAAAAEDGGGGCGCCGAPAAVVPDAADDDTATAVEDDPARAAPAGRRPTTWRSSDGVAAVPREFGFRRDPSRSAPRNNDDRFL